MPSLNLYLSKSVVHHGLASYLHFYLSQNMPLYQTLVKIFPFNAKLHSVWRTHQRGSVCPSDRLKLCIHFPWSTPKVAPSEPTIQQTSIWLWLCTMQVSSATSFHLNVPDSYFNSHRDCTNQMQASTCAQACGNPSTRIGHESRISWSHYSLRLITTSTWIFHGTFSFRSMSHMETSTSLQLILAKENQPLPPQGSISFATVVTPSCQLSTKTTILTSHGQECTIRY